MVVDSMQPHFVGVDSDILSTGLVFYYLKVRVNKQVTTTITSIHRGRDIYFVVVLLSYVVLNKLSV